MRISKDENAMSDQHGAVGVGLAKKMYYSISEVCAATGIEPHVLRYWEKEFSLLRPKKNSGGKRAYKEKDIETIIKIKRMLEEDKYTLQGAKSKLTDERRELRGGGSAAVKRVKADPVGERDGSTPISTRTNAAGELTKRKSVLPKNNDGDAANEGVRGVDDALVLSIRDELNGVLALLERKCSD